MPLDEARVDDAALTSIAAPAVEILAVAAMVAIVANLLELGLQ